MAAKILPSDHIVNNSEWLREQYEELSLEDIARKVGVSPLAVRRRLVRFGIPVKSRAYVRRNLAIMDLGNGISQVPLAGNRIATIDTADRHLVEGRFWHLRGSDRRARYAVCHSKERILQMHRLIMDASDDVIVDHINGDGLDNRRCNLRLVTQSQNQWNRRSASGSSSSYVGVSHRGNGRWRAAITKNNKCVWLGTFGSEEEAACAYDVAARKMHGEFARLNFADEPDAA